jgi:hypothetical protein
METYSTSQEIKVHNLFCALFCDNDPVGRKRFGGSSNISYLKRKLAKEWEKLMQEYGGKYSIPPSSPSPDHSFPGKTIS